MMLRPPTPTTRLNPCPDPVCRGSLVADAYGDLACTLGGSKHVPRPEPIVVEWARKRDEGLHYG